MRKDPRREREGDGRREAGRERKERWGRKRLEGEEGWWRKRLEREEGWWRKEERKRSMHVIVR